MIADRFTPIQWGHCAYLIVLYPLVPPSLVRLCRHVGVASHSVARCRKVSRKCRESVAKVSQNVAKVSRSVAECRKSVAKVSRSVARCRGVSRGVVRCRTMSQQPITASLQSVQLCLLLLEYRLCDGYMWTMCTKLPSTMPNRRRQGATKGRGPQLPVGA